MRKQIGSWLFVLASLAAPAAAHAQELHKWCATPLDWTAPPAEPAAPPAEPRVARLGMPADEAPPPAWPAPPYTVRAQDIGNGSYVPPVDFVGPFSHPRYEDGGWYVGAEFMFYRQSRPLLSQSVAFRGGLDTNGGITGVVGLKFGSQEEALNTNQVQGPGNFQPGTNVFVGYRFRNGVSVAVEWMHLTDSRNAAGAGLISRSLDLGLQLENTFLYANVVNYPIQYGGNPANVLVNGNPAFGSTFGIWNAASEMTIQFIQRFEEVQLNARIPVWETETYRSYGIFGPRALIMWEKFQWRTVDRDTAGQAAADTTANYNNIVSNRLYGVHVGSGHDWYLNTNGPLGAFAVDLSIEGALYLDFVKGRARYELGDKSTVASRARNFYTAVPGIDGKLALMWYPWEAIQLRLGYSFIALFNTAASPRPIDFNFGVIDPQFDAGIARLLHGIDVGICFVF